MSKNSNKFASRVDAAKPAPVVDAAPVAPVVDAAPVAQAPYAPAPDSPATVTLHTEPPTTQGYHLLPGKSLSTKRGILATERGATILTEIKPDDVTGGAETLDRFVASGHLGRW